MWFWTQKCFPLWYNRDSVTQSTGNGPKNPFWQCYSWSPVLLNRLGHECWLLVVCWHGTSESQTFFQQYACNNGHHPALVLVPRKICISCFTLVAPHCVASQCLLAGSCCASEGTIQASSLKRSASCAFLAAPPQTLVASVAPAQDKRVVHELSKPGT